MMKVATTLECVVRTQPARSAKVRECTEIAIFLGPLLVASKVIGGRWNALQGMNEYRRNPKSFKHEDGMEAASSLKAAA